MQYFRSSASIAESLNKVQGQPGELQGMYDGERTAYLLSVNGIEDQRRGSLPPWPTVLWRTDPGETGYRFSFEMKVPRFNNGHACSTTTAN